MSIAPRYDKDVLSFRRQFVLGPREIDKLSGWKRATVGGRLHLRAHPLLEVTQLESNGLELTLLGFMLDPREPSLGNRDILDRILSELREVRDAFELTYTIGGRWILIIGSEEEMILLNDPMGFRQVVYTNSGSGAPDIWCASQPGVIADELGLRFSENAREFMESSYYRHNPEYWWPVRSTPYEEIEQLLPNHYLDVRGKESIRFWPRERKRRISLDEGVSSCSELLSGLMKSANERFELAFPITAGQDSRLLLASARNVSEDIYYYTLVYHSLTRESPDIVVPSRLLKRLGLEHHVIDCPGSMDPEFEEIYMKNVVTAHPYWGPIAQCILDGYPQDRVCVKGNGGETTRCYYHKRRYPRRMTPEKLAYLGDLAGSRFAIEHIRPYLQDLKDIEEKSGYRALDLFHWEQRNGRWQAMSQLEWDIAQEVFSPYNCRKLMTDFWSVDESYRKPPDYTMHFEIMRNLWEACLSEPINPKSRLKSIKSKVPVRRTMRRLSYRLGRLANRRGLRR